jgi:hypothetical protein
MFFVKKGNSKVGNFEKESIFASFSYSVVLLEQFLSSQSYYLYYASGFYDPADMTALSIDP